MRGNWNFLVALLVAAASCAALAQEPSENEVKVFNKEQEKETHRFNTRRSIIYPSMLFDDARRVCTDLDTGELYEATEPCPTPEYGWIGRIEPRVSLRFKLEPIDGISVRPRYKWLHESENGGRYFARTDIYQFGADVNLGELFDWSFNAGGSMQDFQMFSQVYPSSGEAADPANASVFVYGRHQLPVTAVKAKKLKLGDLVRIDSRVRPKIGIDSENVFGDEWGVASAGMSFYTESKVQVHVIRLHEQKIRLRFYGDSSIVSFDTHLRIGLNRNSFLRRLLDRVGSYFDGVRLNAGVLNDADLVAFDYYLDLANPAAAEAYDEVMRRLFYVQEGRNWLQRRGKYFWRVAQNSVMKASTMEEVYSDLLEPIHRLAEQYARQSPEDRFRPVINLSNSMVESEGYFFGFRVGILFFKFKWETRFRENHLVRKELVYDAEDDVVDQDTRRFYLASAFKQSESSFLEGLFGKRVTETMNALFEELPYDDSVDEDSEDEVHEKRHQVSKFRNVVFGFKVNEENLDFDERVEFLNRVARVLPEDMYENFRLAYQIAGWPDDNDQVKLKEFDFELVYQLQEAALNVLMNEYFAQLISSGDASSAERRVRSRLESLILEYYKDLASPQTFGSIPGAEAGLIPDYRHHSIPSCSVTAEKYVSWSKFKTDPTGFLHHVISVCHGGDITKLAQRLAPVFDLTVSPTERADSFMSLRKSRQFKELGLGFLLWLVKKAGYSVRDTAYFQVFMAARRDGNDGNEDQSYTLAFTSQNQPHDFDIYTAHNLMERVSDNNDREVRRLVEQGNIVDRGRLCQVRNQVCDYTGKPAQ